MPVCYTGNRIKAEIVSQYDGGRKWHFHVELKNGGTVKIGVTGTPYSQFYLIVNEDAYVCDRETAECLEVLYDSNQIKHTATT